MPATGLGGSGLGQRGPAAAGSVAGSIGLDPLGLGLDGLGSDTQSDGLQGLQEVSEGMGTTSGTGCAAGRGDVEDMAADSEGGRGSEFLSPPPSACTGLGERKIFSKGDLNS